MKLKNYLPVVGVLIFLYILLKLNVSNVLKEILNANILFLIVAVFFVFISLFTETLKWFFIAKTQTTNVPFSKAFKINMVSNFYGFITPSRVGGAMRAEYLKEYNGNLGKGLSNYVLDKVLDLCALVFLSIMFSYVFKDLLPTNLLYYAISAFILLCCLLFVFINKERSRSILKVFYKKLLPKKIKEKAREGFYSFYEDMPKKRYFILFFALNILNWIVLYTISYFIGISLGINISFIYFLAIMPLATLVAQIPITISGLGTREAALISLFGLFGISSTKVFSMSLVSLFLAGIIPAIIGSILIFKINKNG